MLNALIRGRVKTRAQSTAKPSRWKAALIGLAVCAPSLMVAVQAWAEAPGAIQAAPFTSDRLSVEVLGQGPDVILIPGFASSREVWRATAERLKATHRVHLVQLAGFAGEPWTHGDGLFVDPVVAELDRYIRSQSLSAPAVVGHSMGALIGLKLAQAHPGDVGRLMSVDSLPFFSALYGAAATAETAQPFADQAAQAILTADNAAFRTSQEASAQGLSRDASTRSAMVDWSMNSDRRALASAIREVMTTDARPGLAAMTTPVTALYAADDNGGAPAAMADAIWRREYAALPQVELIRVDASRHFIMADQPERFATLLDDFLDR